MLERGKVDFPPPLLRWCWVVSLGFIGTLGFIGLLGLVGIVAAFVFFFSGRVVPITSNYLLHIPSGGISESAYSYLPQTHRKMYNLNVIVYLTGFAQFFEECFVPLEIGLGGNMLKLRSMSSESLHTVFSSMKNLSNSHSSISNFSKSLFFSERPSDTKVSYENYFWARITTWYFRVFSEFVLTLMMKTSADRDFEKFRLKHVQQYLWSIKLSSVRLKIFAMYSEYMTKALSPLYGKTCSAF